MTENALSILIVIFSVQLQQTEISERELFIFHLGVRGNTFLVAQSVLFRRGEKHQHITKM